MQAHGIDNDGIETVAQVAVDHGAAFTLTCDGCGPSGYLRTVRQDMAETAEDAERRARTLARRHRTEHEAQGHGPTVRVLDGDSMSGAVVVEHAGPPAIVLQAERAAIRAELDAERASAEAIDAHAEAQVMPHLSAHVADVMRAVQATGAACTVRATWQGAVHVWAGDDADMVERATFPDGAQVVVHRCHVGCSAHCTHDAEAGADVPAWDSVAWAAIDCNGDAATAVDIAERVTGRRTFRAVGMYRGQALPSIIACVQDAEQVATLHAAMRAGLQGFGCMACMAPLDA